MMDLLMEVKDEDGEELDDETIRDLIFGKLFAGHETSAYTAMWAVLFLTKHPHIFQRAKVSDYFFLNLATFHVLFNYIIFGICSIYYMIYYIIKSMCFRKNKIVSLHKDPRLKRV